MCNEVFLSSFSKTQYGYSFSISLCVFRFVVVFAVSFPCVFEHLWCNRVFRESFNFDVDIYVRLRFCVHYIKKSTSKSNFKLNLKFLAKFNFQILGGRIYLHTTRIKYKTPGQESPSLVVRAMVFFAPPFYI